MERERLGNCARWLGEIELLYRVTLLGKLICFVVKWENIVNQKMQLKAMGK
jgi:hypothetical protein